MRKELLRTVLVAATQISTTKFSKRAAAVTVDSGYIQMELITCCLGRKHKKFVLFWKIFNSYIYVSVDCEAINNSGRYFTFGVCNLENTVTKLSKGIFGS